jgi:alpha-1,3-fucosyltransferase
MNQLRRIFIALILLLTSCLLLLQYRNVFLSQRMDEIGEIKIPPPNKTNVKRILYWTPMFQAVDFNLGLGEKIFENCTYNNCHATHFKEALPIEKFDAILFHAIEYNEAAFGKPEKRSPGQVYIFSNQESPVHTPSFIKHYNDFYNWTMTYRLDSDVFRPYGFIEKKQTGYEPPTIEEIQKRPKKIAWFVSNCGTSSQRERLYNEIRKYVQVDVYGVCGELSCPRKTGEQCYKMMESDYKFYLSFENSICEDYVTEKLYSILKRNIVPIVYGGADYATVAPPKSVIDVMDFKSVKDLAEYIRYLDHNPEEYLKYFEWKRDYVADTSNKLTLCSLCQKLNQPIEPKSYGDIVRWWSGDKSDKCSNNNFIKHFL